MITLSRHWGYLSSINDIGVFDQAIWGVLHGDSLLNTSQFNRPINWLGFHFHPVLLFFVPFYAIFPNVIWLTIAQALALSFAAWPIFLLASHVSLSEKAGLLWALAYLMNPFLLNAAAWDFHPVTLAVPFVAISMLAIEKQNFRLLLFSSLAILICKEHLGIMVCGFGFLWWVRNERWKPAVVLISLGMLHFFIVLGIIMPAFSPKGEHIMLGEELGQLSRYNWLGNSLKEIAETIIMNPLLITKKITFEMGGLNYLTLLLIPFLGFPLMAPAFLFPGFADVAVNILSTNPMPRSILAYHSASLIPVLIIAAIYGTDRLSRWQKKFSANELAGFVMITTIIAGYGLAPLPLPVARNHWTPTPFFSLPDPAVPLIRTLIGNDTSASAQANVGAHFSQRREIYLYPNKVGEVDVILLRLKSPTTNINNIPKQLITQRKYLTGSLDAHLQMDRTEYVASIESLLAGNEYGILRWDEPWLVLKKGIENKEPESEIEQKLSQLRREWQIK
jgi:uncharacterized membrane protein